MDRDVTLQPAYNGLTAWLSVNTAELTLPEKKAQVCSQCNDKLKLIRDIKAMVTAVHKQKKEREDRILGEYKNLHKY